VGASGAGGVRERHGGTRGGVSVGARVCCCGRGQFGRSRLRTLTTAGSPELS